MTLADKIGIVNDAVITISLVIAGFSIWWQLKQSNEDSENGTYDSLDVRFTEFLKECGKYPELEVYNPDVNNWANLSIQQYRRQLILYQILVSILERAYILYHKSHIKKSKMRKHQWQGWKNYIDAYIRSPTFRYAWDVEKIGEDMDRSFIVFMQTHIAQVDAEDKQRKSYEQSQSVDAP